MGSLNDMLKATRQVQTKSLTSILKTDKKTFMIHDGRSKVTVKWPEIQPQKTKKYFIASTSEGLIKYLERCMETGVCSFDFETGPNKKAKEYFLPKIEKLETEIEEMKHTHAISLASTEEKDQKKLDKVLTKIQEEKQKEINALNKQYGDTTYDPHFGTVTTVSISAAAHESCVIYLSHTVGENWEQVIEEEERKQLFFNLFEDYILSNSNVVKVAYNFKFENKFLNIWDKYISKPLVDPMIAMIRVLQIASPNKIENPKVPYAGMGLKDKTLQMFGHTMMHYEDVISKNGVQFFNEISTDNPDALQYSAEDSDYSLQHYEYWKQCAEQIEIERERLEDGRWSRPYGNYWEWLVDIEMSFTRVTALMEYNGLLFNMEECEEKQKFAESEIEKSAKIIRDIGLEYEITVDVGSSGGTNSVKSLLIDTLQCPIAKTSDETGATSLDKNAIIDTIFMIENKLEDLDEEEYLTVEPNKNGTSTYKEKQRAKIDERTDKPTKNNAIKALKALQSIKSYGTLLSSHIEGRKKFFHPITGRIHAEYDPWTETSRLSSKHPKQHWGVC